MTTHSIINIAPTIQPGSGHLTAVSFVAVAMSDDGLTSSNKYVTEVLDRPRAPAGDEFTDAELNDICDTIAMTRGIYGQLDQQFLASQTPAYVPPPPPPPPTDAEQKANWMQRVDQTIGDVLDRFNRFQNGYLARESAARAYKAAGYTGDVDAWISGYATNAGVSLQVAADTIIGQADALRAANMQLDAVQRMRKYAILNAATIADAQAVFDDIMANVTAIAASLS
jgi:hypothetical protein